MAGKTSSKNKKPTKGTATKKSSSAKGSTRSTNSKTSARKAKPKKGTPLIKRKSTKSKLKKTSAKEKKVAPKENSLPSIEMEKVQTIKGIIELPKRRRGRPTKEEEDLRTKILKEHGITGDPRVKRPRGRPRKDQSNQSLLTVNGIPSIQNNSGKCVV